MNMNTFYYRVRPPVFTTKVDKILHSSNRTVDDKKLYFNSFRSAIYFFLKQVKKEKRCEKLKVGLQAFTCRSVLQAILESGNEAIFHDISLDFFSAKPESIQYEHIDVLILTHLFGIPNPYYEEIARLCKKNNVLLFDDLAMSKKISVNNITIGELSDAFGYSYGFDKPISCYKGGELIVNNPDFKNLIHNSYQYLKSENDNKSKKDLNRLKYYYHYTDPGIANQELQFINYIEPFLYDYNNTNKWYNYVYKSRINSKFKIILSRQKIKPLKLGKKKIEYLEITKSRSEKEIENRDEIGREILKKVKRKYPDAVIPNIKNIITTLHRPPVLITDSELRNRFTENQNVQFGAYNWSKILPKNKSSYKNSVIAANNIINLPNWDNEIIKNI